MLSHERLVAVGVLILIALPIAAQDRSTTSVGIFAKRLELKRQRVGLVERQQQLAAKGKQLASRFEKLRKDDKFLLDAERLQSQGRKWTCNAFGTKHDDPSECSDPGQGGSWSGAAFDPALLLRRQTLEAERDRYEREYDAYEKSLDQLVTDVDAFKKNIELAVAAAPEIFKALVRVDEFLVNHAEIANCNQALIASANEIGYQGFDGLLADQIYDKVVGGEDSSIIRLGTDTSPNEKVVGESLTPLEKGFDMAAKSDDYRVYLAISSKTLESNKPARVKKTYKHGHVMELIPGGTGWRSGEVIQAVHGGPKLHVAPLGGSRTSATATWQRPHYEVFALPVKRRSRGR